MMNKYESEIHNKNRWNKWVLGGMVLLGTIFLLYDNPIKDELFRFLSVLSPFIVGTIFAYLLSRPSSLIEGWLKKSKHKVIAKRARSMSVIVLYLLLIGLFVLIVRGVLPLILINIRDFSSSIHGFYLQLMDTLYHHDYPAWLANILTRDTIYSITEALSLERIMRSLSNYAPTLILAIINMSSSIINGVISVIFSMYMLIYRDSVFRFIKRVLSVSIEAKTIQQISHYTTKSSAIFYRFIYAQSVDALILGTLATLMLFILGVEYALLFGVFLGFCNMIPYFGSMVGSILTTLITVFTGGPQLAFVTGICLLILQQIDGNFIGPRIMGDSLNINPMMIIVSITIGGAYFGVFGMFLSVPICAILKLLVDDYLDYKKGKQTIKSVKTTIKDIE